MYVSHFGSRVFKAVRASGFLKGRRGLGFWVRELSGSASAVKPVYMSSVESYKGVRAYSENSTPLN